MNQSAPDIAVSVERIDQVDKTVHKFVRDFVKPDGPDFIISDFLSIYHPEIEWYDHAFHIKRVGHKAVLGLLNTFTTCNDPFTAHIQNIHHIAKGAVLEQVWTGCQSRDIVRKDGTVALQASGKHFECHVCMVIEIDNQGKIVRIDEYYNKRWDEGRSKDRYVCMQD